VRGRIIDGGGQQLSCEVVSTFRQDHRQLPAGSCVQLGGTAGAGASTLGHPLEADVEQAFLGKLVEVELRGMTSNAESVRGLVSTYWRGLGAHVQVEVAPDRVGERRNASHTRRKIVSGHECRLF
jgi:alpha-D-ribose 1-methylphosphonate 5-triphosphate synthase subunit PhnL